MLQRLQIGVHQLGVAGEHRIVHVRLAEQGEDHLGAAPVGEARAAARRPRRRPAASPNDPVRRSHSAR